MQVASVRRLAAKSAQVYSQGAVETRADMWHPFSGGVSHVSIKLACSNCLVSRSDYMMYRPPVLSGKIELEDRDRYALCPACYETWINGEADIEGWPITKSEEDEAAEIEAKLFIPGTKEFNVDLWDE